MTLGVVEASTTQWIVGLAAIVGFFVLYMIMAFVLPRRRRETAVDAQRWRQSTAEPWGTIALTVFFLFPVALAVARGLGASWLAFPMLAAVVAALWAALGGSDHLRELAISEEDVEWRTIRRRRRVPLDQVVAVSDPARTGEPPEVWLSDGSLLRLPASEEALAVARTLAGRIGQPWPPAVPDAVEW